MAKQNNRDLQVIQNLITNPKKKNTINYFSFLTVLKKRWYIFVIVFCLLFPKVPAKITYNIIDAFKTEHVKIFSKK